MAWPASAKAGWTTRVDVADDALERGQLDLAMGADGSAAAAWIRAGHWSGSGGQLAGALRGPGGEFGESVTVSRPEEFVRDFDVAVGPGGEVLAVWVYETEGGGGAAAAYRPPGGSFEPARDLAPWAAAPEHV